VGFCACVLVTISTTPNHKKPPQFGATVKKNAKLHVRCFDAVRKHTQHWNKWILDDCWIDIINEQFDIPTKLRFISDELNRAVGGDPRFSGIIDSAGESNVNGVCKATHQVGAKSLRLTACHVTSPMEFAQKPGGNTKWFRNIVSAVPTQPSQTKSTTQNPKRSVPVGSKPTKRNFEPVQTRKKRIVENKNNSAEEEEALNNPEAEAEAGADANPGPDPTAQAMLDQSSWWDTGDATGYFGAIDDEVSPKEAVEKRIVKLKKGHANATGWKLT
jgi:hypothetical protein